MGRTRVDEMARLSGSVDLGVTPSQVWEASLDSSRWPDWIDGTLSVSGAMDPLGPGSTYQELTRVIGPWRARVSWEVTDWVDGQLHEHTGFGVPFLEKFVARFEVGGIADRGRLTVTFGYVPRGLVGRLATAIVLRRRLERSLARTLQSAGTGKLI